MILGLDVSTSTIGWAVVSKGNLVDAGFIPLKSHKSLISKAKSAEIALNSIFIKHPIEHVYIEECFQRFARGLSSAATITKLASFNGIIQYVCFEVFAKEPALLNVNKARKSLRIQTHTQKKCGISIKEQVFKWVTQNINYPWPTKILKSGPRKGLEINLEECYDIADAYVIARAGFVHLELTE
jgi:Holliday junction resolvasome RuvABC endonuclease subunit